MLCFVCQHIFINLACNTLPTHLYQIISKYLLHITPRKSYIIIMVGLERPVSWQANFSQVPTAHKYIAKTTSLSSALQSSYMKPHLMEWVVLHFGHVFVIHFCMYSSFIVLQIHNVMEQLQCMHRRVLFSNPILCKKKKFQYQHLEVVQCFQQIISFPW
jgi:hypothetical protein